MPKVETYHDTHQGTMEITIKPASGDLRFNTSGQLEKLDDYDSWVQVGDLQNLFNQVVNLETKVDEIDNWKLDQQYKYEQHEDRSNLEEQFPELEEAGKQMAVIEEQARLAKEHLTKMDDMLRSSREAYRKLTKYTEEKIKTFEILETETENNEEVSI